LVELDGPGVDEAQDRERGHELGNRRNGKERVSLERPTARVISSNVPARVTGGVDGGDQDPRDSVPEHCSLDRRWYLGLKCRLHSLAWYRLDRWPARSRVLAE
jgi:hypothetical protein